MGYDESTGDLAELREEIASKKENLTRSQQDLAEYLMNNHQRCAFMTASEIGEAVGVSESTVVRFACALGFEGFPALRSRLQDILKARFDTIDRTEIGEEGTRPLPYRAMQVDVENIEIAQKANRYETLQQAVEAMLSARRIGLLGFRSARAILHYTHYNLSWVLPDTEVFMIRQDNVHEQLVRLDEDDLVLAITMNRYPKKTVEGFRFASEQGCVCIGFTDSVLSPLSEPADILLLAPGSLIGFVDSFVTPLSIIRALLLMIVSTNEDSHQALKRLEEIWENVDVYED